MIRLALCTALTLAGPAAALETADCVILPGAEVELGAPSQGLLKLAHVDRNDRVEKGAVLAELHAELEEAAHALAVLRAQDDAAIRTAEIWLAFEREMLGRATALSDRAVLSDQALAERRTNFRVRESELAQARLALRQAQLELEQAAARLEIRRIRSPINGVVVARLLDPGEFVREDTPVFRLAQIDRLRVEVFLPQAAYSAVAAGMTAEVVPESGLGPTRAAVVDTVDPLIDPASGTFGVRLALDNADGAMVAGVRCTARFPDLPGGG